MSCVHLISAFRVTYCGAGVRRVKNATNHLDEVTCRACRAAIRLCIAMQGAPWEEVLSSCRRVLIDGCNWDFTGRLTVAGEAFERAIEYGRGSIGLCRRQGKSKAAVGWEAVMLPEGRLAVRYGEGANLLYGDLINILVPMVKQELLVK